MSGGQPYSALRHLSWAILGERNPDDCHFMIATEYAAYFDASGKPHDPKVFLVSGFVSSERKWLRFGREWTAFLGEWGIAPPFHTTDYIHAHHGTAYAQFRGDDGLRDEFERQAVKIIRRGIRKPFSCGLILDDYRRVLAEYDVSRDAKHFETPYSLCAMHCAVSVAAWGTKHMKAHEHLLYVYEDGDDDKGHFMEQFKALVGYYPNFGKKGVDYPQFDAADILAWRHARLLKNTHGSADDSRHAFATAFNEWPHHGCIFMGEKVMRALFEQHGIPRVSDDTSG